MELVMDISSSSSSSVPSVSVSSPYEIILISLSAIPISHYIFGFLLIFIIVFYNILEIHFFHDLIHGFRGDPVSLTYASDSQLYQSVVSNCKTLHSRYLSTPWLTSPHLQTTFLGLFGRPPPVSYKRQLFRVPDGGTIALDWLRSSDVKRNDHTVNRISHVEKTPIVILIPGLTSDSTSSYIKHFAFRMAECGWNVVVSNHRGLGGISLTSDCVYNAGWTEDIRRVVGHIHSQHSEAPLFVVGTSLGANVLVKYLGEDSADVPICGAAAISSPWDLLICDRFMNRRLVQKFYNVSLASGLQGFALLHQSNLSRLTDWECIKKSRSVRDFDHYATRILGNFETVDAYYRHSSSTSFVGNVAVPLLCINALDDPVCTKEAIPWDECRANRNIVLATTPHGGHLAFYEGVTAKSLWWVRAVDEFFGVLQSSSYIDVIRQTQKSTAPIPMNVTIDQGPYVSVLEDGMVTAIGDEQADDGTEDAPNQHMVNLSINERAISEKEEADDFIERTHTKNDQSENNKSVTAPVRKCIDTLARQSRKSIWLLAYIAIVTSWPLMRPSLSLLFKKRLKNIMPGGSHKS